jgi:hypothetical protein
MRKIVKIYRNLEKKLSSAKLYDSSLKNDFLNHIYITKALKNQNKFFGF